MDSKDSHHSLENTTSDMSFETSAPIMFDTTSDNTEFDFSIEDTGSELTVDLTTSPSHGPSESNRPIADDHYLSFLLEAGIDTPEALTSLGIDIDEIYAQQQIEANIQNTDTDRDFQIAQEMQRQINGSSSTPPQTSITVASASTPSAFNLTSLTTNPEAKRSGLHSSTPSSSSYSSAYPISSSRTNYTNDIIDLDDLDDEEIGEQLIDLTRDDMDTRPDWASIDDDEVEFLVTLTSSSPHAMRVPRSSQRHRASPYTIPSTTRFPNLPGSQGSGASSSASSSSSASNVANGPLSHISLLTHPYIPSSSSSSSSRNNIVNSTTEFKKMLEMLTGRNSAVTPGSNIPSMAQALAESTKNIASGSGKSRMNDQELRDLLQNIEYDDPPPPEDRTGTPEGLVCNLLEHQKIGLEWMKKMEGTNNKGGILADDMGLGKTVQAMATILARPCENVDPIPANALQARDGRKYKIKATLIVCPVSLIDQWRREVESKTDPQLKVMAFHGTKRSENIKELAECDVIITSYGIVATNFSYTETPGPLSKCIFHRVILDEAHMIKNESTRMAVGCCQIQATYRWCLTATPIQNKVEELYSLIKFLRIRPFCDWTEFRTTISGPIKKGDRRLYEKGVRAAQFLLKAICLRRSKKTLIDGRPILNLPARNVNMTHIDFTRNERSYYNALNTRVQSRFNAYVRAGTVMKHYSSVLVLLLRLRQACLHPELTLREAEDPSELENSNGNDVGQPLSIEESARRMKPEVVTRLLNSDGKLTEIECPICMDLAENAQIISGCGHILCKECFDGYINSNGMTTKRCPTCRGDIDMRTVVTLESFLKVHAPEQYEEAKEELTREEVNELRQFSQFLSSTKIDKMLDILKETKEETDGKDKTIVFSQFTSFLDLVEEPLQNNGHKFLRYDGSMDVKKRAQAVNQFFEDPEITVLLVSTKCGSLGLNLTVANRVILLDLWWNPAMENQAIDRVHRIGQSKPVEVHRLFINDTVEDRILRLQQKKQALSDSVLGEGPRGNIGRIGLQEMMYLFRGGDLPASLNNESES